MSVISVDVNTGEKTERPYTPEELEAIRQAAPTTESIIKQEIMKLEGTITTRRLLEYISGEDTEWVPLVRQKIAELRKNV